MLLSILRAICLVLDPEYFPNFFLFHNDRHDLFSVNCGSMCDILVKVRFCGYRCLLAPTSFVVMAAFYLFIYLWGVERVYFALYFQRGIVYPVVNDVATVMEGIVVRINTWLAVHIVSILRQYTVMNACAHPTFFLFYKVQIMGFLIS